MTNSIPEDFTSLLPRVSSEEDDRPIYYLWIFDPSTTKVKIEHNEDRHPADAVTHQTMAPDATDPERVMGYAYPIKDGWRITDNHHGEVKDPFVLRKVEQALNKIEDIPLPHIPHHRLDLG